MHRTKLKHKKGAWFVPLRGSYIPIAWQGWLTYIPFVAFLVYSYVSMSTYAHSVVQTVLWTIPDWIAAAVVMTWIARRTS